MRRYLFSIVLAIFTIGGIGFSYLYGAVNHLPDYKLVTVVGDEQAATNIELSGAYYLGVYSSHLSVNEKGSQYSIENNSFRQQILNDRVWYSGRAGINELVINYKGFMRGKSNVNGLYADDEWIIYVDSENRQGSNGRYNVNLYVTTLNKKTELVQEYDYDLADRGFFTIRDVQLLDDHINIIAAEQGLSNDESYLYSYIVDVELGSLDSFERLIVGEPQIIDEHNMQAIQVRVSAIVETSPTIPSDYIVLTEVKTKSMEQGELNQDSPSQTSYYGYSYRTEEVFQLPVEPYDNSISQLIHNVFTYVEYDKEKIIVSRYALDTKEFKPQYITFTAEELGLADITRSKRLEDNYLYIFDGTMATPTVVAIDLSKGELVYRGQVIYDGDEQEAEKQMAQLHLNNINIKLE
ncbi:MAG TPA: hypothetical protein IAA29_14075 [Candidatus Paenibacillus intestinavium]|nr:hypothetical protein [Candidatus Paenibacillus intestinavium]